MEGTDVLGAPYETSQLHIIPLYRTVPLVAGVLIELTIQDSSLINAFCGTPSSSEYQDPRKLFYNVKVPLIHSMILAGDNTVNAIIHSNTTLIFDTFPGFVNGGALSERIHFTSTTNMSTSSMLDVRSSSIITKHKGCSEFNDCSGHGYCDYCYQKCICVGMLWNLNTTLLL